MTEPLADYPELSAPLPVRALHIFPWPRLVMGVIWLLMLGSLGYFLSAVEPILLPFVMGFFIAYLTHPMAQWMGRKGMSRSASAGILTLSFFAMCVVGGGWLLPILYHQATDMVAHAPMLIQKAENAARLHMTPLLESLQRITAQGANLPTAQEIPNSVGDLGHRLVATIGGLVSSMLTSAASLLNLIGMLLLTPVVCFYFIRDWPSLLSRMDALLPRASAPVIREQVGLINQTLAAYLRGQVMVMMMLSVYYCILLSVLGLEHAVLLGLLAGMIIIIPYVGTLLSIGLGVALAYGQMGISSTFWGIVGVYGVGQILEGQILIPKIVGKQVGLHPLWLLFGMLAGGALLGFVGVLLAVPITAVISVLARFAIARYLASPLYHA